MKHLLNSLAILIGAVALSACGGDGGTATKCSTILPGDLVITEFLKNPKGTDKGQEWFEIHNPGDIELDLVGIDLAISRPDGSQERRHRMLAKLIEAGSYLVVGDAEPGPEGELPEWIDYSYRTSMGTGLPNTAGRIALKCGGTIIDEVIYEDGGREAYALQLNGNLEPDGVVNDDPANWCDAAEVSYDGGTHFGTPGKPNTPCGAAIGGACADPVTGQLRDAIVPTPGQLVITEVMPNPEAVSDTDGEWFEVHAPGAAVDLNGLLVGPHNADPEASFAGKPVGASETCLTVPAGGYAVLSRKLSPADNGGIHALTTFNHNLANAGGSIELRAGDTVLDVLIYGSSRAGRSIQLSRGLTSPEDNDDQGNLCDADVLMANGDYGTPGAENAECPIPLPDGACREPVTGTVRQPVSPVVGDLVISEVMAQAAGGSPDHGEWFEVYVARDVDLNGIRIAGRTDTSSLLLQGSECIEASAGDYLLFARNEDAAANGGLPEVFAGVSFALVNGTNASPGEVRLLLGETLLDSVSWTGSTVGVSTQVRPDRLTATDNDVAANFCAPPAGSTYGSEGRRGTPGAANVCE